MCLMMTLHCIRLELRAHFRFANFLFSSIFVSASILRLKFLSLLTLPLFSRLRTFSPSRQKLFILTREVEADSDSVCVRLLEGVLRSQDIKRENSFIFRVEIEKFEAKREARKSRIW